jgi:twitching motility protein PilT
MIVGSAGLSPQLSAALCRHPSSNSTTTAPNKAPHKAQGAKDSPSLEAILRIANDAGHSDVHLGVGERPRFRARGEIQATDWPATDDSVFQGWLHEILSPQQIDSFYRDKELDSAYAFPFVHVRINVLDSLRGPAMVLRLIPQTILTMEDLKLPEVLKI